MTSKKTDFFDVPLQLEEDNMDSLNHPNWSDRLLQAAADVDVSYVGLWGTEAAVETTEYKTLNKQ